jgi:hypothetical protein
MSKRDIVKYTKALWRAGVLERPSWMSALERCAARRRRSPPLAAASAAGQLAAARPGLQTATTHF